MKKVLNHSLRRIKQNRNWKRVSTKTSPNKQYWPEKKNHPKVKLIGSIDCHCSLIYFSSNNTSAGVFQTKAPPVPELTDFLCRSLIVERCRPPTPLGTPGSDQLPSTSFITPTPLMYVLLKISHSESCVTRINPLWSTV